MFPSHDRQVMEATDEEGWFTRNLDWDESEDRVEFKKQMSLKPSMQLPTSRSSVGMKVNIGGKDYLIESPILDQQNNPATQAMKDLNTFLETPENSRALLKLGPNTIVEAVKTDQGFNGDTHNGFNVEFIQHALHYGPDGAPIGSTPIGTISAGDLRDHYIQNMMIQDPFGNRGVLPSGYKKQP